MTHAQVQEMSILMNEKPGIALLVIRWWANQTSYFLLWLWLSILPTSAFAICQPDESVDMDVTECLALWQLYNETDGPNWHKWTSDEPFDQWPNGPSCDGGNALTCIDIDGVNHVKAIHLNRRGLNGSLSNSIFAYFPYLERIELYENTLSGSIPQSISNLPRLTTLYLQNNEFTGSIPDSLLSANEGTFLYPPAIDLSHNQLSGQLPRLLGNDNMDKLSVRYNEQLTGAIPHSYIGKIGQFWYSHTNICEPQDQAMQDWLKTMPHSSGTGISCDDLITYTVSASTDGHAQLDKNSIEVEEGQTASFTVTPDENYRTSSFVGGNCPEGSWQGQTYTTGQITADCNVQFLNNIISLPELQLDVDVIQTIRNPVYFVPGKPIHVRSYVTCPDCRDKPRINVRVVVKLDDQYAASGWRDLVLDQNISVEYMRENPIFGRSHDVDNYSFDEVIKPSLIATDQPVMKKLEVVAYIDYDSGYTLRHEEYLDIRPVEALKVGLIAVNLIQSDQTKHEFQTPDGYAARHFAEQFFPAIEIALAGEYNFVVDPEEDIYDAGFRLTSELAKLYILNLAKGDPAYLNNDQFYGISPRSFRPPYPPGPAADADPFWSPHSLTGRIAHGHKKADMARMLGQNLGLAAPAWIYYFTTLDGLYRYGDCKDKRFGRNLSRDSESGLADYWPFRDEFIHTDGLSAEPTIKYQFKNSRSVDFMSVCYNADDATNAWISYSHDKLLKNTLSSYTAPNTPTDQTPTSYLLVTGAITRDLDNPKKMIVSDFKSEPLQSIVALPRSDKLRELGRENRYCVGAWYENGRSADSQCFDLDFHDVNSPDYAVQKQYFQVVLNNDALNAGMLVTPMSDTIIMGGVYWIKRSPTAPKITNATLETPILGRHPADTGIRFGANTQKICWEASDADGDAMSYRLEYSPNNGAYWSVLVSGWKDTCYEVNLSALEASDRGRFRVTAMDGFNASQAYDIPGTVLVQDQGPQIFLHQDNSIANVLPGEEVTLSATATDREDGMIEAADLVWTDAQHSILGNQEISVTASREPTAYTVSATDSAGYINQAKVWVTALGCGGKDIRLDDMTVQAPQVITCATTDRIDMSSRLWIEADAELKLISNTISLGNGFHARQGSQVSITAQ